MDFSKLSVEDQVKIIMTQTTYNEEEALEKMKLFNNDGMRVIKDFMGIPEKKVETKVKSINQEVYRQIRTTMDVSMKEYRDKNPINLDHVIENFAESDEREINKNKNR